MPMAYCACCGKQLPEYGTFCPNCGSPIGGPCNGGGGSEE